MPRLRGHGIEVVVPAGWEGHVGRRPDGRADAAAAAVAAAGQVSAVGAVGSPDEVVLPAAHLATVPLPAERGDFGSGAVDTLGSEDVFVGILEYGPECVGTAAFAAQGIPRRARSADFGRRALQRTIDGQAGWQHFFTEAGRAFCLYVVLGRDHDVAPLLRKVNLVLADITIEAAR